MASNQQSFNFEKFKSIFRKIIWIIITICFFVYPNASMNSKPELSLTDSDVYIDEYYSGLNSTTVSVYLTFNREVDSGYAKIRFYDSSNNLLSTESVYLYAYGEKEASGTAYVDGKVATYYLVSYSFEPASPSWHTIYYVIGSPIVIMFLIAALLISYREYEYEGVIISVYAGWYHHTLRIDGELYDEHSTLITYSPIYLSTTIEDYTIEARITLTNRISVKVNDKLI